MTIAHGALRRAGLAGLAFATLSLVACGGPGVQSIPDSSQGRMEVLAERFPASSEASVYMTNLPGMSKGFARIDRAYGDAQGGLREMQAEVKAKFGIDLQDPKTLETSAGIAADGGLAFGVVDNRPVLLVYVIDAEKFDGFVTSRVKEDLGVEADVVAQEIEGVSIKVLGDDVSRQIAWTHFGKVAILSAPQLEAEMGGEASIAKHVYGIYSNEADSSTRASGAFKSFVKEFGGRYAIAAFANPDAIKKSPFYPGIKEEIVRDSGEESVENFEKYCTSLGLGFDITGDVLKSTAYFGGNADFASHYEGLSKVADATFGGFATSTVMVMGRISVNMAAALKLNDKFGTNESRAEFDNAISEASQALGFDVKAEFLDKLTGNMAGYFYGVDLGAAMQGANNPAGLASAIQAAGVVQFTDDKAPLLVLSKIVEVVNKEQAANTPAVDPMNPDQPVAQPSPIVLQPMAGGQGVSVPGAGHVVAVGDLLVVASAAVDVAQIEAHVNGTAGSALSSPLGKPFADAKAHGGLYINIEQIGVVFGALLAGSPEAQAIVNNFRDAAIYFDSSDRGISGTFELELVPEQ